jgi:hypothetical protein
VTESHASAPVIDYSAKLAERRPMHDRPDPSSWFLTHGFGKPAAGTYTEVRFAPSVIDTLALDGSLHVEAILDGVVRRVAADLYGTAWAFHYRPDEYARAIEQYRLRLREVVEVSSIEVYL